MGDQNNGYDAVHRTVHGGVQNEAIGGATQKENKDRVKTT